jgi:OmpA-OmpF porin, OOP family
MTPSNPILRTLTAVVFALLAWSVFAQPSTEQMIEQLKASPPAEAAKPGLTRGLRRNLVVEAADVVVAPNPSSTPAAPRPALSLNIQFDLNSAQVQAGSQQALRNLAQALQSPALLGAHFAIEGHTDAKGRADYNQKLSQQRAQAVRDFLAQQGVDGVRLQASGKGSSELAKPQDPFAAENRRVRIVNLM